MELLGNRICSICRGNTGLFGNRKLYDGRMCKSCAKKTSPHIKDIRKTTISDMKAHLAYREANKTEVAGFNASRTIGTSTRLLIDEDTSKFVISTAVDWRSENPDVISFSQVRRCTTMIKRKLSGATPSTYHYEYDFYVTFYLDLLHIDAIEIKLNLFSVPLSSKSYAEYERMQNDIRDLFQKAVAITEQ